MGLTQVITGVAVFVTGLIPMSCHTTATTKKSAPANATTAAAGTNAPVAQHDLGEVALTNHLETCVNLGGGKDCLLTPRQVDSRTYQLTLSLESKTRSGQLQDLSVTQITTKSGSPVDVAVGDFQLSFTPKMVTE